MDYSLGGRDYFDLSAAFTPWHKVTLRAGINNIFDRDPPLVDSANGVSLPGYNGNTFPQLYDTLGRFFVDVTADF
jgi:outer membrane receptor protein involved in Fe transport